MLVFVYFAILVEKQAFIWQYDFALIGWLFVYIMDAETFVFQIAANSEIGCPRWF